MIQECFYPECGKKKSDLRAGRHLNYTDIGKKHNRILCNILYLCY